MITNQNEAKIIIKHIQCDCKWKFNSTTCYSNKNEIMKYVNKRVKIIVHAKKDYSWNLSTCICENSNCLKSIAEI